MQRGIHQAQANGLAQENTALPQVPQGTNFNLCTHLSKLQNELYDSCIAILLLFSAHLHNVTVLTKGLDKLNLQHTLSAFTHPQLQFIFYVRCRHSARGRWELFLASYAAALNCVKKELKCHELFSATPCAFSCLFSDKRGSVCLWELRHLCYTRGQAYSWGKHMGELLNKKRKSQGRKQRGHKSLSPHPLLMRNKPPSLVTWSLDLVL